MGTPYWLCLILEAKLRKLDNWSLKAILQDWTGIKSGNKLLETGRIGNASSWGAIEAAVKLIKSTLGLTLAIQITLNYAELDTLFSSVGNTVNQRLIAVKSFTDKDIHPVTPNTLLLGRSFNSVTRAVHGHNDSLPRRQKTLHKIEQTWWN